MLILMLTWKKNTYNALAANNQFILTENLLSLRLLWLIGFIWYNFKKVKIVNQLSKMLYCEIGDIKTSMMHTIAQLLSRNDKNVKQ